MVPHGAGDAALQKRRGRSEWSDRLGGRDVGRQERGRSVERPCLEPRVGLSGSDVTYLVFGHVDDLLKTVRATPCCRAGRLACPTAQPERPLAWTVSFRPSSLRSVGAK